MHSAFCTLSIVHTVQCMLQFETWHATLCTLRICTQHTQHCVDCTVHSVHCYTAQTAQSARQHLQTHLRPGRTAHYALCKVHEVRHAKCNLPLGTLHTADSTRVPLCTGPMAVPHVRMSLWGCFCPCLAVCEGLQLPAHLSFMFYGKTTPGARNKLFPHRNSICMIPTDPPQYSTVRGTMATAPGTDAQMRIGGALPKCAVPVTCGPEWAGSRVAHRRTTKAGVWNAPGDMNRPGPCQPPKIWVPATRIGCKN